MLYEDLEANSNKNNAPQEVRRKMEIASDRETYVFTYNRESDRRQSND